MKSGGLPDLVSFKRLARSVTDIRAQTQTTRTEAVTGRYEDIVKSTKGEVGAAHLLRKAIDDISASRTSLSISLSRAGSVQTALGLVAEEGKAMAAQILGAIGRGDETILRTATDEAAASIATIVAALNATSGGRPLFGGNAASGPALAAPERILADVQAIVDAAPNAAAASSDLDFYFNDPTGGFATTIYTGGPGEAPPTELAPGVRVSASVKADAEPLRVIIRGLATAAALNAPLGMPEAERVALLSQAANEILEAEVLLTDERAIVGISEGRMEDARARLDAEEAVLTSLYNARTARDPFEAASQLQLLETQLTAAYIMTGRVSQLSLANFLR